jgi:hypothetical protein
MAVNYLVIDIETRPSPELVNNEAYWKERASELEAPGNYKDPAKIEAWKTDKLWQLRQEMALSPLTGQVCCFGVDYAAEPGAPAEVISDAHEYDLLVRIAQRINRSTVLVGFNIRSFDLPFLWARMAIAGLAAEMPAPRDYRKVGELRDVLTEGPLYQWAKVFGYPIGKPEWDGEVPIDELAQKCRQDVTVTALIAKRLQGALTCLQEQSRG